jgi:deoxycytidine triphosphate deaminase
MELVTGKDAAARVQGMIHPKYQVHRYSVYLTVKMIFSIEPTGRVDFGGKEYATAGRVALELHKRSPEDRYLWWNLGRGAYFVEFNETLELPEDEIGVLEPDERLLRAGATHGTIWLRGRIEPVEMMVEVGALHLAIKNNARTSRIRVYKLEGPQMNEGQSVEEPKLEAQKPRRRRWWQ